MTAWEHLHPTPSPPVDPPEGPVRICGNRLARQPLADGAWCKSDELFCDRCDEPGCPDCECWPDTDPPLCVDCFTAKAKETARRLADAEERLRAISRVMISDPMAQPLPLGVMVAHANIKVLADMRGGTHAHQ